MELLLHFIKNQLFPCELTKGIGRKRVVKHSFLKLINDKESGDRAGERADNISDQILTFSGQ